ncbi:MULTISPECIES: DUF2171 domain-containing protein [unclassified Methylobacterium]|jgi:hypothetical protein|uniref:DUF2171 domain-containing protein n=1 Tax=unclassified Methylobacterium TaxID=2615210 RepID=UPI0006FEA151|nr:MULTISPECIES: DUF2171 domain-containing protein [unclassified Methylobacterium]KQO49199.1 hypothetical protein ASF24_08515 [Methylobacterium sp. Leaf86]KQP00575.1 hypothetical protein ASF32_01440 [Methylobacterium sp. Leaf91]MBO1019349.1 DUF2171 domain-containing protein [Methylobacterium sp. SD274]
MVDPSKIQDHMPVIGSDGGHVGTVDHLDGQRIKLTRTDPEAKGQHHFIHVDSIDTVEDGTVKLNRTTAQAKDEWGTAE